MRRWLGHVHIPQRFAPPVDEFTRCAPSPAVSFHRPCTFAVERVDEKGRVRRTCPHGRVQTPCERLRGLDGAERFPKPDVTFDEIDRVARGAGDLAAMREVNDARAELFRRIGLDAEAEAA